MEKKSFDWKGKGTFDWKSSFPKKGGNPLASDLCTVVPPVQQEETQKKPHVKDPPETLWWEKWGKK